MTNADATSATRFADRKTRSHLGVAGPMPGSPRFRQNPFRQNRVPAAIGSNR
jgi:hypothetical protein